MYTQQPKGLISDAFLRMYFFCHYVPRDFILAQLLSDPKLKNAHKKKSNVCEIFAPTFPEPAPVPLLDGEPQEPPHPLLHLHMLLSGETCLSPSVSLLPESLSPPSGHT